MQLQHAKKQKKKFMANLHLCNFHASQMDDIKNSPTIKDIDRISIHKAMDSAMQLIETTPEEIVSEAAHLLANYHG